MTQPPEPNDDVSNDQPESANNPPEAPQPAPQATPQATPQWPSSAEGTAASAPLPKPAPGLDQASAPPPPPPVYGPTPQTSNNAVAALVLSIVSWVFCPVIPAIITLVFAAKADKEIAASNGWITGAGMVTASKIVAWINIGLYAALTAIGFLVFLIAVISGAMNNV